jgi:hypothetical protein
VRYPPRDRDLARVAAGTRSLMLSAEAMHTGAMDPGRRCRFAWYQVGLEAQCGSSGQRERQGDRGPCRLLALTQICPTDILVTSDRSSLPVPGESRIRAGRRGAGLQLPCFTPSDLVARLKLSPYASKATSRDVVQFKTGPRLAYVPSTVPIWLPYGADHVS